ncbi:MAG: hypothetical protein AABX93_00080 [Nanoarchaeota archaeon]
MSKVMIFSFVVIALLFIGTMWFLLESPKSVFYKDNLCGDGSLENTCSDMKPYFCYNGVLSENAIVCGCDETLSISGNSCVSELQTESNEVKLKYVLRGKEQEINYFVYGGLTNYLSELPVYINYDGNSTPSRTDFKLRNIDEATQREFLLPLVVEIQNRAHDKEEQARIAISIVQNLNWGFSNKTTIYRETELPYSRHPYEVLYDTQGVCGEKSEVLAFLLREIGYGVVFFYNQDENHESIGIKCPVEKSWHNSRYCFIETTGPSIITDTSINYVGGLDLKSEPEILFISDGDSLNLDMYEYKDAEKLADIKESVNGDGFFFNPIKFITFWKLERKYGLAKEYNAG